MVLWPFLVIYQYWIFKKNCLKKEWTAAIKIHILYKCITANTSAVWHWQHAARSTEQPTSPSCKTEATHKILGGFQRKYTDETTNIKAEIRPEEQSEKAESCQENLWNEIQLKGPYRQKEMPRAE